MQTFFLVDLLAQDAVAVGIADAIGVPRFYVKLTVSILRRLADLLSGGRRLSGMVKIDYTIRIPPGVAGPRKNQALRKAAAVTPTELTVSIRKAVAVAKKNDSFIVTVATKSRPIVDYVPEGDLSIKVPPKKKRTSGTWQNAFPGLVSFLLMSFFQASCSFRV